MTNLATFKHIGKLYVKLIHIQALKFLRKSDDVSEDIEEMKNEQQEQAESSDETFTLKKLVTSADLRLPLIIAVVLQVIQQFSGINAVSVFSFFDSL